MLSHFLSGTIKTLGIYNDFTKAIWSVVSINIRRDVHSKQESEQIKQIQRERHKPNIRKAIEKAIGTSKPKQPLSPYFRFMQQIRPSVIAEYPHLKSKELYTVITERWELLSAKEKEILSAEYRNDMLNYSTQIKNFNSTISGDDMRKIQRELDESGTRNLVKSYKKKARELNKPRRPPNPFLKFLHAQTDRQPNEQYKDYIKRMSAKWQVLSETKKKKYKTKPEELDNYKKAMLAWENAIERSMKTGCDDADIIKFMHNDGQGDEECVDEDEFDEEDL